MQNSKVFVVIQRLEIDYSDSRSFIFCIGIGMRIDNKIDMIEKLIGFSLN